MAGRNAHQFLEHPPEDAALGVSPAIGEQGAEALELRLGPPLRPAPRPGELDLFESGAVEPEFLVGGRQVFPGRVEERAGSQVFLRFGMSGDAGEEPPQPPRHVAERAQHPDRPLAERFAGIRDELHRIDAVDVAQTLAGWAGALWAIEAEELRLWRGVAHAAGRAGIRAGEHEIGNWGRGNWGRERFSQTALTAAAGRGRDPFGRRKTAPVPSFIDGHDHLAAAGLQGECHRLSEPAAGGLRWNQPIDDDVDRVLDLLLERRRILDPADGAVDAGARKPLADEISEQIAMLSLGVADERCEQHHSRPVSRGEDSLHDLIARLRLQHAVAPRAVGRADPCIEHAEEVVDLGHRGDRRPRVGARRLLRDRDRGRESGHAVDVGSRQLPEKLPGEGGQALDIPPLPFGVERVERQARLARATHAGKTDEPAPWQPHRDVAEVVFPGSADDDRWDVHAWLATRGAGGGIGRRIVALDSPWGVPYHRVSRGKSARGRTLPGAVAQLGERGVRNAEVGSSILLRSTVRLIGHPWPDQP